MAITGVANRFAFFELEFAISHPTVKMKSLVEQQTRTTFGDYMTGFRHFVLVGLSTNLVRVASVTQKYRNPIRISIRSLQHNFVLTF